MPPLDTIRRLLYIPSGKISAETTRAAPHPLEGTAREPYTTRAAPVSSTAVGPMSCCTPFAIGPRLRKRPSTSTSWRRRPGSDKAEAIKPKSVVLASESAIRQKGEIRVRRERPAPLPSLLNDEEAEAHARFLAGLGIGGEWALAGTFVAELLTRDTRVRRFREAPPLDRCDPR